MLTLFFLIGLLFILLCFFQRKKSSPKIPTNAKPLPEPPALPFLGHVTLFWDRKEKSHEKLARLSKEYGPIFGLKFFNRQVIVLNGLDVIKRALNDWSFADRPDLPTFRAITEDEQGDFHRFTFMKSDSRWKFYRKNSMKALSLFSSSKNSRLQALVEQGCKSLWSDLEAKAGRPMFAKEPVFECTSGIIGSVTFGLQFDRQDPLLKEIVGFTDRQSKFITFANIMDYLPGSRLLLHHMLCKVHANVVPVNNLVDQHLKNHNFDSENVGDVADALFKRSSEISDEEYKCLNLTKEHLQRSVLDLFVAGFVTVTETFLWSLACMAKFSDVQEKVQRELDENLRGRFPTVDDKVQTPYTEATILEVFRFSSLIPFSIPHATTSDTIFEGYFLPQDAVVMPNLWAHHYDPEIFSEPTRFKPERFLDQNGQVDVDFAQNVIPFGVGKRRCAGENLARQEVYLLFASTIQKFRVSLPSGENDLDFERDVADSFIRVLKPSRFVFHSRY